MLTGDNVTSTLTDLERKLVDLERELSRVAGPPPGPEQPAVPAVPPTPAETQQATLRVEDLRGEIADLVKFRDQLEAVARELVRDYDRLVARLKVAEPSAANAPAGVVAAGATAPAPEPREDPGEHDSVTFVGAVEVDAGPFHDIATLQGFEQALVRVDGAEDVYVRSFEGNRALIDVRLSNPVALVQQLRERLALPITAREAGERRLAIDLAAAGSHGT